MGSTSTYRASGISDLDFFTFEFPTMLGERGEVVAHATRRVSRSAEWSGVWYAAVRQRDTGETWALVVFTGRHGGQFFYKEMSESMGPEATAPANVLNKLTPTDNEHALMWRAECRANIAARAARPKVTAGDRVKFTDPLRFTNGDELSVLTFVKGSTFQGADGRGYRIPRWRERGHALVAA